MATIMIVDDDQFLHKVFERLLLIIGHEVVAHAYDGQEAVDLFTKMREKPDVILMDQRMPIMSGIQATGEILKLDPNALIIFVSADDTVSEETVTAGATGFLAKPIREVQLRTALRVHLQDKFGKETSSVKSNA